MAEPSIALADALKNITQATLTALRSYEGQSRKTCTEIESEMRALRKERDDAMAEVQQLKHKDTEWRIEVDKWKVELEKVDVALSHRAQLVDHYREEAQQWRDHCVRLEERSRLEVRDWKSQFMRVDQERARLAARIDALLPDSLESGAHTARLIPRSRTTDLPDTRNEALPPRASTSALAVPLPVHQPISPKKPRPSGLTSAPTAPPTPGSIVVRRVHATFDLPVKEEEGDSTDELPKPVSSAPQLSNRRRASAATPRSRTKYASSSGRGSEGEDGSGEYVDGGGVSRVQRTRRQTAQLHTMLPESETDGDDDELALGAEDNPQEIYGHQAVTARPKSIPNTRVTVSASGSRKRKAASDAPTVKATATSRTKKRR